MGFDAICYNSNTAYESRNSSRRGSISSIQVKRKKYTQLKPYRFIPRRKSAPYEPEKI